MMRAKLMGISQLTISNLSANEYLIPNPFYTQSVRWKRKPIWLPTAKSKMFRVPSRPVIPHEEAVEIRRLYNNYRTYMRSIIGYIRNAQEEEDLKEGISVQIFRETVDFKRCEQLNDAWNRQRAMFRNKRLKNESLARESQILQKLLDKEKRDNEIKKMVDEKIRKLKQEVTTFITAENIEEAVEKAMSFVVCHDSYLDEDGKIYKEDNGDIDARKQETVNKKVDVKTKTV